MECILRDCFLINGNQRQKQYKYRILPKHLGFSSGLADELALLASASDWSPSLGGDAGGGHGGGCSGMLPRPPSANKDNWRCCLNPSMAQMKVMDV